MRRDSQVYQIAFENGDKVEDLHVIGTCGKRNTGTSVHFYKMKAILIAQNFQFRV